MKNNGIATNQQEAMKLAQTVGDTRTIAQFASVKDLHREVLDLPEGEERNVYVGQDFNNNPTGLGDIPSTEHKAIFNTKTNKIACVVSRKYALLQHQDAFLPVVEAMQNIGLECEGVLKGDGNKVFLWVFPDGMRIKPKDGDPIQMGLLFRNSYDGTNRYSVMACGLRLVCSNGLVLPDDVKYDFSHVHKGKMKIIAKETIINLFKTLKQFNEGFEANINEAMENFVALNEVEKAYAAIGIGDRVRKKMMENLDNPENPSMWDLHNSISSYVSHKDKVSMQVYDSYSKKANRLLKNPIMVRERIAKIKLKKSKEGQ